MRARALAALLAAALAAPARATVMTLDPSARTAALGSASTAASGDPWAVFSNPGNLATVAGRHALLSQAAWIEDARLQSAGAVVPFGRWTAGAGYLRLSHGELEGRDDRRRPTGGFAASEDLAVLSLAGRHGAAGAGVSFKLMREKAGAAASSLAAMDLGLSVSGASPLSWGLALRNARPGAAAGEADLSAGAAWRAALGTVAVDVSRPLDGGAADVRMGFERPVGSSFSLRAGYAPRLGADARADAWRAGLGFRRGPLTLDYALVPAGDLGATQRLSLDYRF